MKYGSRDYRGGGRSSARETAARVAAAAIAKQLLQHFGIDIKAYVSKVGNITVEKNYQQLDLSTIENNIEVSFLKRTDALKARRIIEGLKILSDQKVDLSHIPTHELIEKVDNLGSVKQ